jgi:putative ABC transport system substrate-binding protein
MMDRRRFLVTSLTSALAVIDFPNVPTGSAQTGARVPTIGYLSRGFPCGRGHDGFRQGLRDLGYDEDGRKLLVHHRFAEGSDDRLAELAAELVRLKVDIVVASAAGVFAIHKVTTTIPVVFWE